MYVARPYQRDLVGEASQMFNHGICSLLIQLATGGGKTVCAGLISVAIARRLAHRKGCTLLYLVHRDYLVKQTVQTLTEFGLGDHIGIIQSGQPITPWAPLQVAGIQTLTNRLEKYDWLRPRFIFIDEAHHIRATTWEKIIHFYVAFGAKLIGLTATPARLDGKGLGKVFEHMIMGPSIRELVDQGHLCATMYYSIPTHIDITKIPKSGGDYSKKAMAERSNLKFRADVMDVILNMCGGRRVIHFAYTVDDSIKVSQKLSDAGLKSAHVDGKTPKGERDSIIERFDNGDLDVLNNYEIVSEGYDVRECDAIVVSRKTASTVLMYQMYGRGKRPKPDGRSSLFIDTVDNFYEHGHPENEPHWTLEEGVVKDCGGEAEENRYRSCKSCGLVYVKTAGGCPNCGHAEQKKTVVDVKVELELKKAEKQTEKERRSQARRESNREVFLSGGDPERLNEIRRKYGYHPRIIEHWNRIYEKHWEAQRETDRLYESMYNEATGM